MLVVSWLLPSEAQEQEFYSHKEVSDMVETMRKLRVELAQKHLAPPPQECSHSGTCDAHLTRQQKSVNRLAEVLQVFDRDLQRKCESGLDAGQWCDFLEQYHTD